MAHFQNIIIGSGQAGVPLAHYLAKKGEDTLIVEREKVGGTCLNTGCTPSKTMYEAVRKMYHAQHTEYAGFTIERSSFDFNTLMTYVRNLRDSWSSASANGLAEAENLTLSKGNARFKDEHTVVIDRPGSEEIHSADKIFINTGGRPRIPEIEGLDTFSPLTSSNIFELTEQPKSLIIIGGGYIGLEFAQMFARLGTRVDVINHGLKIISKEDDDIIQLLQKKLEKEGVDFHLNSEPQAIHQNEEGVTVNLKNGVTLTSQKILVAAGRIPNTDQLNLENTSLETDEKGILQVNEVLQTKATHIFAMGEVAGTPKFTHMAYDDFRIIKTNLEKPKVRNTLNRTVPYTLFTDPQLARFGMNEKEANKKGIEYKLYEMPMSSVARASEKNEAYGKIKALCHPDTEELLGATILGVDAGEMMTVLQMAFSAGITAPQLQEYIFTHPLLAEGFNKLFTS